MSIASIVDFKHAQADAERFRPDPGKILGGDPQQTVFHYFSSPCGRVGAGIWEGDVGSWTVNYTENEYCEILSGVAVLRDAQGASKTVRTGDRFVIPAGFVGTWEVVERCRKIYVIAELGG